MSNPLHIVTVYGETYTTMGAASAARCGRGATPKRAATTTHGSSTGTTECSKRYRSTSKPIILRGP